MQNVKYMNTTEIQCRYGLNAIEKQIKYTCSKTHLGHINISLLGVRCSIANMLLHSLYSYIEKYGIFS